MSNILTYELGYTGQVMKYLSIVDILNLLATGNYLHSNMATFEAEILGAMGKFANYERNNWYRYGLVKMDSEGTIFETVMWHYDCVILYTEAGQYNIDCNYSCHQLTPLYQKQLVIHDTLGELNWILRRGTSPYNWAQWTLDPQYKTMHSLPKTIDEVKLYLTLPRIVKILNYLAANIFGLQPNNDILID